MPIMASIRTKRGQQGSYDGDNSERPSSRFWHGVDRRDENSFGAIDSRFKEHFATVIEIRDLPVIHTNRGE
jgi:hypothetical protein